MPDRLVREESPVEFFREQLARAMGRQKVTTSAFTEYYLVDLLARCVDGRAGGDGLAGPETPLASLYARALGAPPQERARILRALGDTALFLAGFFADSLRRRLVDLGYCRALGGHAYHWLSREGSRGFAPPVFSELAGRFVEFADVLAEVSEQSRLTSQASIVRLYERWEQTGSRRAALLLAERGISPVAGRSGWLQ